MLFLLYFHFYNFPFFPANICNFFCGGLCEENVTPGSWLVWPRFTPVKGLC